MEKQMKMKRVFRCNYCFDSKETWDGAAKAYVPCIKCGIPQQNEGGGLRGRVNIDDFGGGVILEQPQQAGRQQIPEDNRTYLPLGPVTGNIYGVYILSGGILSGGNNRATSVIALEIVQHEGNTYIVNRQRSTALKVPTTSTLIIGVPHDNVRYITPTIPTPSRFAEYTIYDRFGVDATDFLCELHRQLKYYWRTDAGVSTNNDHSMHIFTAWVIGINAAVTLETFKHNILRWRYPLPTTEINPFNEANDAILSRLGVQNPAAEIPLPPLEEDHVRLEDVVVEGEEDEDDLFEDPTGIEDLD